MSGLVWLPLAISAAFFALFCWQSGRTSRSSPPETLADFFVRSSLNNSPWMFVCLVASTLTVTGGLVASIGASVFYGPVFLFAPATYIVGLIVFATFFSKRHDGGFINEAIASEDVNAFGFGTSYLIAMVLLQAFLIGWEFYIVAGIFAEIYGPVLGVFGHQLVMIMLLAVACGIYVTQGGWERAVRTDLIQAAAIVIFVAVVLGVAIFGDAEGLSPDFTWPQMNPAISNLSVGLFVVAVLVTNIPFALTDITNWQVAASSGQKPTVLLVFGLAAAVLTAFFLAVFFLSGYVSGGSINVFLSQSVIGLVLAGLLPLFSWSTADTRAIGLSRAVVNHIGDTADRELSNEFQKALTFAVIVLGAVVAYVLSLTAPNIFIALLGSAGSMIVFTPYMVKKWVNDQTENFKSRGIVYLGVFAVAFLGAVVASMTQAEWAFIFPLFGLMATAIVELTVFRTR